MHRTLLLLALVVAAPAPTAAGTTITVPTGWTLWDYDEPDGLSFLDHNYRGLRAVHVTATEPQLWGYTIRNATGAEVHTIVALTDAGDLAFGDTLDGVSDGVADLQAGVEADIETLERSLSSLQEQMQAIQAANRTQAAALARLTTTLAGIATVQAGLQGTQETLTSLGADLVAQNREVASITPTVEEMKQRSDQAAQAAADAEETVGAMTWLLVALLVGQGATIAALLYRRKATSAPEPPATPPPAPEPPVAAKPEAGLVERLLTDDSLHDAESVMAYLDAERRRAADEAARHLTGAPQ